MDKKLVSVCTFEGKGGFGCNPKYLVEKLHEKDKSLKFVWFVNENAWDKEFPDYIKKVKNTIFSRAYYLSKSKVWIDNYRKPYGTVKRRGQYYINTNHYTLGIKTVGLWRGEGFSKIAYMVSKNDSDMIDDLVIDSKFGEAVSEKGLVYDGYLLKSGAPRDDVLYGDRSEIKRQYRAENGLANDAKILLFAPTFRERAREGKRSVYSQEWTIDFKGLIDSLEKKFAGKWYICVKVHPQLAAEFEDYKNPDIADRILNESHRDDFTGLLAAMDAYITDYSSACFEAGFAHIPVFIYADDIKKYQEDRGSLYWNMASDQLNQVGANQDILPGWSQQFPFAIGEDNSGLQKIIQEFDQGDYDKRLDEFYSSIDQIFDGKASERVADRVLDRVR
ncbi:MAG: CDP-glycerol glycerophosphotransferase family protein [Pseudobutyrivibrio sp.]|nr:CDP-glycerol glycerophosphotransferase family protein [Pseudobutyrivibrio sp.]